MKKLSKIQKIVSGTVIAAAIMISGGPAHSNQEQPPVKTVASLSADSIQAVQGGTKSIDTNMMKCVGCE